jgi:glycosyltransferase involved in cell wall biosynthesis
VRIGVDGRFFSDPRTRLRGAGRYALSLVSALVEERPDVEVTVLVRPDGQEACRRLCPGSSSLAYPEELCSSVPPPADRAARLSRDADVASWISGLRLDVLLSPAPFLFAGEPQPPLPGAVSTVLVLHDLIPFAFRSRWLTGASLARDEGLAHLARMKHADAFVAASEFVRREAGVALGVREGRLHVGYPVPARAFRPVPPGTVGAALGRLGLGRAAREGFVLAAPETYREESLGALLGAWGGMPAEFRERRSLVVICDLSAREVELLERRVGREGLERAVFLADYLPDEDLAALYTSAWAYVHLPRHEGFALPVVEARACAAATLAQATASLSETAGDGGILVAPGDPEAFRGGLLRLDRDPGLLASIRQNARAVAARFSSRRLADAIVAAATAAVDARRGPRGGARRLRVGIVSPVPPQQSGVADYAAELANVLGRSADVELFVDRDVSPVPELDRFPTFEFRRLAERTREPGLDVVLHQMGASVFHLFVDRALREIPGIVTMHDLLWARALYHLRCGSEALAAFEWQIRRLEGSAAVSEFRHLLAAGGPALDEGLDEFFGRHPLLGDIVRASRGVVVHFPEGERRIRELFPGVPVRWFPMGVADPRRESVLPPAVARARHGFPSTDFLVGAFGIADPVKRLHVVVRALSGLVRAGRHARLVVVGRFSSDRYREELEELAARLEVGDRVHLVGAQPMEDFEGLLGACDAVVNLRFPSHLQMSATLVRAMGAARPVVATDLPEWRFLPAEACVRLPVGEDEPERLRDTLDRWIRDPAERERRGAAARGWFLGNATLEAMSANYLAFARDLSGEERPGREAGV